MNKFIIILFIFGLFVGVYGIVGAFCKNPYYVHLIAGFLAAVLIYLLYKQEEKFKPLPPDCIETSYLIVYRNDENNTLYSLPYLDLRRTEQVWGFALDGIKISKEEAQYSNTEQAKQLAEIHELQKIKVCLPDWYVMLIIGCNIKKIDRLIKLLNENAVKADRFSYGHYWCADTGIWGKLILKVIFPRAGSFIKIISSRYRPQDLKEVFYVRLIHPF